MANVGRYRRVKQSGECNWCDYLTCYVKGTKRTRGKMNQRSCPIYRKDVKKDNLKERSFNYED